MKPIDNASASLRANILKMPSGHYLTAGQNQFLTLWTRDFCHAVRGLLAINEDKVVRDHLSYLLKCLRPSDGLVPRVVDNHLVQLRVAWQSFRKMVPFLPKLSFKEPLKPQYTDEHGSCAVDSNLLMLLASLMLRERNGGDAWWKENEGQLKKAWSWYDDKFQDGLITQSAFADWQDSAKREGKTFLTNIFYFLVASRLKKLGWEIKIDLDKYREDIKKAFYVPESGVYKTMENSDIVSVEGNLFILEASEFLTNDEKKTLWANLKKHPVMSLDGGVIGRCSYPDYENKDIAWHVKFANLHGYHGSIAWSWLMGLGLKVSMMMEDQETTTKQKNLITKVLDRDGEVLEVYCPDKEWQGWGSWLLTSEHPFAWGSGYLVEALKMEEK